MDHTNWTIIFVVWVALVTTCAAALANAATNEQAPDSYVSPPRSHSSAFRPHDYLLFEPHSTEGEVHPIAPPSCMTSAQLNIARNAALLDAEDDVLQKMMEKITEQRPLCVILPGKYSRELSRAPAARFDVLGLHPQHAIRSHSLGFSVEVPSEHGAHYLLDYMSEVRHVRCPDGPKGTVMVVELELPLPSSSSSSDTTGSPAWLSSILSANGFDWNIGSVLTGSNAAACDIPGQWTFQRQLETVPTSSIVDIHDDRNMLIQLKMETRPLDARGAFGSTMSVQFIAPKATGGHQSTVHSSPMRLEKEVEQEEKQYEQGQRPLSGWFSSLWHCVRHIATVIVHIAEDVAEEVAGLIKDVVDLAKCASTGCDYSKSFSVAQASFNYNPETGGAAKPITLGNSLTCSNCFFDFDMGVEFHIEVADLEVQNLTLAAWGQLSAAVQLEASAQASWSNSTTFDKIIGKYESQPVLVTVLGVVFTVFVTVPIHVGLMVNTSVSTYGEIKLNGSAAGYIQTGMFYRTGMDSPQWINEHALEAHGGISGLGSIEAEVDLRPYIKPVIVVDVDKIGYVSLGAETYANTLVSVEFGNASCSNRTQLATSAQNLQVAVSNSFGVTLTIKAGLHLIIPVVNINITRSIGPFVLWHYNHGLPGGCWDVGLHEQRRPYNESLQLPFKSRPMSMTGDVWFGTAQRTPQQCTGMYGGHALNVTFRALHVENGWPTRVIGQLIGWNVETGAPCVVQGMFDISVGSKQISFNAVPAGDPDQPEIVELNKCTDGTQAFVFQNAALVGQTWTPFLNSLTLQDKFGNPCFTLEMTRSDASPPGPPPPSDCVTSCKACIASGSGGYTKTWCWAHYTQKWFCHDDLNPVMACSNDKKEAHAGSECAAACSS